MKIVLFSLVLFFLLQILLHKVQLEAGFAKVFFAQAIMGVTILLEGTALEVPIHKFSMPLI